METSSSTDEHSFDPNAYPDLLPIYYQRLFPFHLFHKWLKYNDEKNTSFSNREFSFTLADDVYLRFQSYVDEAEMKKDILKKCPHKIDLGAIYSFRPREQRTVSSFHPVEKELVFDIDMTDYDEVRTCCTGADICKLCWPFMTVALKILNRALREDFGFKHLLWVYSGRRGIHCWVCDEKARKLSPSARSAIVEYLSLVKGGAYKAKKVYFPDVLHPSIEEAKKIVEFYFEDLVLKKQNYLDDSENCKQVAALCLDTKVKEMLEKNLPEASSSQAKWLKLREIVDVALYQKGRGNKNTHLCEEIMFQLCYPRLDVNVSKGLNHLLKAPFCVHPKTGKVCVPIDVTKADEFNPMTVPTISQLCDEIDKFDAKLKSAEAGNQTPEAESRAKNVPDSYKTSLRKCIKIFEKFVEDLNTNP